MDPLRYESTPYDRAKHEGFVKASWVLGARHRWETLCRFLRHPETLSRVAHLPGKPDDLIGWAVVNRGRVVWAYTRRLFGKLRRRGLMTSLLFEMGIDPSKPTPCLFWSPDAAVIAVRGYRFIFSPRAGLKEAA